MLSFSKCRFTIQPPREPLRAEGPAFPWHFPEMSARPVHDPQSAGKAGTLLAEHRASVSSSAPRLSGPGHPHPRRSPAPTPTVSAGSEVKMGPRSDPRVSLLPALMKGPHASWTASSPRKLFRLKEGALQFLPYLSAEHFVLSSRN